MNHEHFPQPPLVVAWLIRAALAVCVGLTSGCTTIPEGRSSLHALEFEGNDAVSATELEEAVASSETRKFLGMFRGVVYDYSVYNHFVLQRDLARVERAYRARGYYNARVRAGRISFDDPSEVYVRVHIVEGEPTRVIRADMRGLADLESTTQQAARRAVEAALPNNAIFTEAAFQKAEEDVLRVLTERGHAYAKVERSATVDAPRRQASVLYRVTPGPICVFGDVTIRGLGEIPEDRVRRALAVSSGDPYSSATVDDARQALLDLGVFGNVDIVLELKKQTPSEPRPTVPVTVKVSPTRLRTVKLGVGAQLDQLRAGAHALAGWEDRNFLGGLRHFSVEARPGLVFYPTRVPSFDSPTAVLPEVRTRAELRQPDFFEGRTTGFVRTEYDVYPVLISPNIDEDAPVLGYREFRGAVGLERRFGKLFASPSYNLQTYVPFTYQGELDSALDSLIISYVEQMLRLDLRDSGVSPTEGAYFQTTVQFAGVGGDAVDLRLRPEARFYLPVTRKLVLAARLTTGLLFPFNYGETIDRRPASGGPPAGIDRDAWVRDSQLVYFRAFFSGGPGSNRGYPLRAVGPHGVVPFFNPGVAAQQLAVQCDGPDVATEPRCSLPLGGLTLWEASIEARYVVSGPFSSALFCDTGDVSSGQVAYRFDRPHVSCGIGLRYGTPVGPIRADIGYRLPGLQQLNPDDERNEGDPGELLGLPIAFSVGVGEAF